MKHHVNSVVVVQAGRIVIPEFQREYVWRRSKPQRLDNFCNHRFVVLAQICCVVQLPSRIQITFGGNPRSTLMSLKSESFVTIV